MLLLQELIYVLTHSEHLLAPYTENLREDSFALCRSASISFQSIFSYWLLSDKEFTFYATSQNFGTHVPRTLQRSIFRGPQ